MELFDLGGRVAIVTGGNRGIGLGFARGLARAGAAVAIWARDPQRNEQAVAELERFGPAVGFVCDVADRESVETALAATVARFGRVDTLFANAGTTAGVRFEEMEFAEWRRLLDVNLDGAYHTAQAVARQLIDQGGGGTMVFTASVLAHFGMGPAPHYAASKGAVLQLARSLAIRLARHGIRVNVISPGWVETEMTDELRDNPQAAALGMARTPMRRWGTETDFEGAAVFLAAPASGFMTGAELVIDGGYSVV